MPTHTAPTGNYNERLIRGLRSLYTNFYQHDRGDTGSVGGRVYISRGKAQKRKIVNEEECVSILSEFGFKTHYFEDYSFEEQVKIALDTQYLISNHGAGLTNMLFMKSGSSVFELRLQGDAHSNCYFSFASSLNMNYFYQLCVSKNPYEKAHTANLIVDTELLRKNIEQMLLN
jgi:capsular polysaccharide biosynthesis protein